MSKNIGWTKVEASNMAKSFKGSYQEAYPQLEQHWYMRPTEKSTYQWIVCIQKKAKP